MKLNIKASAHFLVSQNSCLKNTEEKVTNLIRVAYEPYELLIASWTTLPSTCWVLSVDHNLPLPLLEPILPRPVTTFYSSARLTFSFKLLDGIQAHGDSCFPHYKHSFESIKDSSVVSSVTSAVVSQKEPSKFPLLLKNVIHHSSFKRTSPQSKTL